MRRRLLLLLAALPLLLVLALPAVASARVPRLFSGWKAPYTNSSVRPSGIGTITGDGSAHIGSDAGGNGAISWKHWSARDAVGVGKIWLDDCIPDTAGGTFHGRHAHIRVFRVRHGHYTRLTVSWRAGHRIWDAGTILYTWKYRLTHWYSGDLIWMRMT